MQSLPSYRRVFRRLLTNLFAVSWRWRLQRCVAPAMHLPTLTNSSPLLLHDTLQHRAASLRHQLDAVRARLHATTGSVAGTKGLLPSDPFYARAQARAVQAATEEVERAAASSPVRSASSASQRRAHRSLVPPPTASSPRLPGGSQRSLSPLTWQGDSEKVSRAAETMRRLRTQVAALTQQRDEAQREVCWCWVLKSCAWPLTLHSFWTHIRHVSCVTNEQERQC